MECVEVCVFLKFYTFTTVETYFLSPNRCETQITKVIKLENRLILL